MAKKAIKEQGTVRAIVGADLHLSDHPPISRSAEPDWIVTQYNLLEQLKRLCVKHKCPLILVGDIFHQWSCTPHLLSRVISILKQMTVYTLPGNHDIPNHNYMQIGRSAYWTLVEAGAVRHLTPGIPHPIDDVVYYSYPYTIEPVKCGRGADLCLHVALVHAYCWTKNNGYPNAPATHSAGQWIAKLQGYDVAFFGDNHKPFHIRPVVEDDPILVNCGCLQRRNSDEREIKPRVWQLKVTDEGYSVLPEFLDVTDDKWIDLEKTEEVLEKVFDADVAHFAQVLKEAYTDRVDFVKIVMRWLEQSSAPEEVKSAMLRAVQVYSSVRKTW